MANMMDISHPDQPGKTWLNLDQVFTVSSREVDGPLGKTKQVVAFKEPGGNGHILPQHITIEHVITQMQLPHLVIID